MKPKLHPAVRALCAFWALTFVGFALLQLNDPDPVQWTAIYLAAAAVSLWGAVGRREPRAPALVGLVALVWALTIVPHVLGHKSFIDNLRLGEGMKDPITEESRELGGLLIVTAWCSVLALASRAKKAKAAILSSQAS